MDAFFSLLKRPFVRRMILLLAVVLVLYWLRSMLSVFLLTFMLAYIGNSAERGISSVVLHLFHRRTDPRVVIAGLYALAAAGLGVFIGIYVPMVAKQLTDLVTKLSAYFTAFGQASGGDTQGLSVETVLRFVSSHVDLSKYFASGGTAIAHFVTGIGTTSVNVFLALVLSLFFLLGKPSVLAFFRSFKDSRLYWMYGDLRYFIYKFSNSFGKVIQTQLLISCINTAISTVVLGVMGFPSVVGLAAMIFVLGLVPVAGVFISLVPLCIIGYSIGGLSHVVWVLILVAVLHALEGYVLNPKLMSQQTRLPVFITFLVLLVAEHVIGVWGLIIGLPLTMFLLDLFDVLPQGGEPRDKEPQSGGPPHPSLRRALTLRRR